MKSTLKIAYAPQGNLGKPVIKIVQPVEVVNPTEEQRFISGDEGPDELIKDFLQFPLNPWLNEWFQVDTRFPVPLADDKPTTHFVTTIEAVQDEDLFLRFKQSILNRIIPYADMVKINRSDIGGVESEKALKEGRRPFTRLDESLDKYRQVLYFFNWLIDDVNVCAWEDQQPDGSQLQ